MQFLRAHCGTSTVTYLSNPIKFIITAPVVDPNLKAFDAGLGAISNGLQDPKFTLETVKLRTLEPQKFKPYYTAP